MTNRKQIIHHFSSALSVLSFTLYVLCFAINDVHAQSPTIKPFISVYPVIFNVTLKPGSISRHEITVKNLLDTPLPLHSNLESFDLSDEDYGEKPPQTLSTWAKIDTSDTILKPHEEKKITVTISLPKEIPLGGYYSNLNLEPRLLFENKDTSAHLQPQIKILFLGSIGVPSFSRDNGTIQSFAIPFLNTSNAIPINFKVKNLSLYHFSGKPIIKIAPLLGNRQEVNLEEKIVLPGRSRLWNEQFTTQDRYHVLYKVLLQVSLGGGIKIVETRYILILPYMIPISISLLSALSILLIIKHKKRISRSLKILFSRN